MVGQSYSQTLAATGGTPPFSWTLDSGALPAGLALNASTGAVTGTPTSAGTESFTVRVTDSLSQTDTKALSIEVAPAPPPPVTISTSSLSGGTVGQAYSETIAASGGTPPFAWTLDSGSLPAGLALNASTGAVTGTPTTVGTATFTARVTDSLSQTDTQALSIEVAPPPHPAILTASLPGGTVGVAYGATSRRAAERLRTAGRSIPARSHPASCSIRRPARSRGHRPPPGRFRSPPR